MRRVIFLVLPDFEVLDLAGPLQAFSEAATAGAGHRVHLCSSEPRVRSAQGLWVSDLEPLPEPGESDQVVIPGLGIPSIDALDPAIFDWVRKAYDAGAHVASVCTGAFVLAKAGLLAGRQCTTHWRRVDELAQRFPGARVLTNRLFVHDGRVTTSAGIASGIDMALALLERWHGPLMVASVAREMVIYIRRDGGHRQQSIYLDYRTHLHPGIHRVQDWLTAHPAEKTTLDDLARLAAVSPRHLTRIFRQATGISIQDFRTRVRLELARDLLNDPGLTVAGVAARCGFESDRQLRRLWKQTFGTTPGAARTAA